MPTLSPDECRRRLAAAGHLVLGTVHAERGVDLVPVVAAVEGGTAWIPVDTVKAKTTTRLARMANVAADPRVVLLAERYDDDWSRLWWVRAHGRAREATATELPEAHRRLATRYPAYAEPASVAGALVVDLDRWTGWEA